MMFYARYSMQDFAYQVIQNDPPQQLSNVLSLADGVGANSRNHWVDIPGCFMRYHDKTLADRLAFASLLIGIACFSVFVFVIAGDYLLRLVGL
jgi:hypothetical protein